MCKEIEEYANERRLEGRQEGILFGEKTKGNSSFKKTIT